jgi:hypothetical protein
MMRLLSWVSFFATSVVQSLQDGKPEERDPFFFHDLFFLGKGRAFDVALLGLSPVDFQGLPGEVQTHVLKIPVHIFGDDLESLVRVDFFFPGLSGGFRSGSRVGVFLYAKTGNGFLNPVVIADGTVNKPESLLFFEGFAVLEPAFEFVSMGTDQIKDDHG